MLSAEENEVLTRSGSGTPMRETGADPMNTFRDPAQNVCVEPPLEHIKFGNRQPPAVYTPGEEGYSRDGKLIEEVMATWRLRQPDLVHAAP